MTTPVGMFNFWNSLCAIANLAPVANLLLSCGPLYVSGVLLNTPFVDTKN